MDDRYNGYDFKRSEVHFSYGTNIDFKRLTYVTIFVMFINVNFSYEDILSIDDSIVAVITISLDRMSK